MTLSPILIITILCAIALGWVGHGLFTRPMPPNGSALQSYNPVWANAAHVKEMKR